jgi:hypothetical protein
VFGDLDDPRSPARQALARTRRIDVLKPETGARPKLFYLNSILANSPCEKLPLLLCAEMPATVVSEMAEGH